MKQIVIKSEQTSPRLDYVLDFIFQQFFSCGYEIVDDGDCHIHYGNSSSDEAIIIKSSDYLFRLELLPEDHILDPSHSDFDLFAYIFYQLSRAEEYNYLSDDNFGRFPGRATSIVRNFSEPTIDIFLLQLAVQISNKAGIQLSRAEQFRLIHTVDVDQMFAYKHKNLKRKLGGLVSNIFNGDIDRIKDRTQAVSSDKDPYDSFDLLKNGAGQSESHYFILVGNYNAIDNALEIEKPSIQSKIIELAKQSSIGIHPSVSSNSESELLQKERGRLESVLSSDIKNSRQHFLCLEFPNTYQKLIEQGIEKDYSMGFHDQPGFRAGTTNSFYWFDLEKNQATNLMIHPLTTMDVSLKKYLKLDPTQALMQTKKLIDQCKKVNGPFCLLWHNSSFYAAEGWEGWKECYEGIVNYCKELKS